MASLSLPAASVALLLGAGCTATDDDPAVGDTAADSGDSDTAGDDTAADDTSGDDTADDRTLRPTPADNYTFEASLDPTVQVAAAGAEAWINWTGLTHDLTGRAVDPTADVGQVLLGRVRDHSYDELAAALVAGTLVQEDVGEVYTAPGDPSAKAPLSALRYLDDAFVPAETWGETDDVWVLAAIPRGRPGALMLGFVEPRSDAAVADLTLTDATATLAFDAHLPAPMVAAADGPWALDWGGLEVGAGGAPLSQTPIDTLWIGRFDDLDLATLEERFLVAESLASAAWSLRVSGADRVDDLAALTDTTGASFPGFEPGPLWAIVLRCTGCTAPAPPFVGLVTLETP